MFFRQIYEKGLAHASYLIGCQASGTAIVIDPQRDIDIYLETAAQEKLRITHIAETHIHADFLSGSRELAARTGAQILASDEGGAQWQYEFEHVGLKDGNTFKVGNLLFEVLHTPGHTPEHISFLLTDMPAGPHPIMIFTGDFVFVGDIGRPDLLEKAAGYTGTMRAGAEQMFNSLQKFRALPDYVQVWPAHGAGSACGKALGAVPGSTVGYEKLVNWAFRYTNQEDFIQELLSGQPEPPYYFAMMKMLNKQGASVLGDQYKLDKMSIDDFIRAVLQSVLIIDTRDKISFAGGHVPGSVNIQNNNSFSTWAGWILPYDKPFVLIARPADVQDIQRKLMRIGLDNAIGYFEGLDEYASAGHKLEIMPQLNPAEVQEFIRQNNAKIIDVRSYSEFTAGHIEGAVHIHAGHLNRLEDKDLPDSTLIVQCQGGDRSGIATSILMHKGRKNVINLSGGINAWREAGYPIV
jgi:hydroxyacylglutathione hydrolase